MDDSTLVQRAVDGDREAFAAIYDRYADGLHDFLWWVLQDREAADDVVVDTFALAAWRLHELRDRTRLRVWLFAIAAREALRREHQRSGGGDGASGEFVEVVRATAQELTPRERALLDLRFRQGFTGRDLGDAIGVRPDYAGTLVRRLAERVESVLGPALALRFSRRNCATLAALLGSREGPLDRRAQRLVGRHTETCPTCSEWRRRVGVATVLGVAPSIPLPPKLREAVLHDVELAAHTGRAWSRRRNGFPRPMVVDRERRGMGVAAAVMAGLVAVGAVLLTRDDEGPQQVASVGATTTSSVVAARTTLTTLVVTTTSVPPEPGSGDATGSMGSGTGSGDGAGTGTGAGPSTTTAQRPQPTTRQTPTDAEQPQSGADTGAEPDTTGTPATTVPDTTGPSLSGVRVSPSVVRGRPDCTNADPTQATVSVDAGDPSGIAGISAVVAAVNASPVTMVPAGDGTYVGTVGPFDSPVPLAEFPATVVVQATDGAGNRAASSGSLTLRCQPVSG